jgi:hypothetical protein
MNIISGFISAKRFGTAEYEDEDDEEDLRSNWWWDFKQSMLEIPRLVTALFIKPDHDGIQDNRDLVYQYGQAVLHIPQLLRRLAFKTRTLEEELHEVSSRKIFSAAAAAEANCDIFSSLILNLNVSF